MVAAARSRARGRAVRPPERSVTHRDAHVGRGEGRVVDAVADEHDALPRLSGGVGGRDERADDGFLGGGR